MTRAVAEPAPPNPVPWPRIAKDPAGSRVPPNLADYDAVRRSFSWQAIERRLGLPGQGGEGNLGALAADRHAAGAAADRVALRCLGRDGRVRDLTFGELSSASHRFSNALASLGVGRGDQVFLLLDRTPELYVAALGAWKAGAVVCPLFPAFGPEPIRQRLALGGGKVLVTTRALYDRKVEALLTEAGDELAGLEHVVVVVGGAPPGGTSSFHELLAAASAQPAVAPTRLDDPAILHFTSGTTGMPKGALHVHGAVVAHYATGLYVLDLHADDVFWCTADPGWVTGTSYGIIAPLVHGVTSVVYDGEFDAGRWYGVLQDQRVTVWYTTPTAIRVLMRVGAETAERFDLSALRYAASVGEALNPEAVVWGKDVLGLPIHDNWWQTETGAIMIANYPAMDVKPGSMGRPIPGVEAAIVRRTDDGGAQPIAEPGTTGEIALRPGWPSMFRAYLGQEERYRACFAGGWYLSGDLAQRDDDGYFWFVGRADDVIKSSGHLIGPFEVESVLIEHPAVAEAAVIGKPDPVAGEVVKAFVALKAPAVAGDELRRELLAHARRRLGAAVAPKEIEIVPHLPRTRSGKILRRLLKARELGLAEGDLSTLEPPP